MPNQALLQSVRQKRVANMLEGEGKYTCPHGGLTYALSEGFLTR